jgi:hypothetical protein
VSVAAGDDLNYSVLVQNNNTTALHNVVLYIAYPDGTKQEADLTKDLLNDTVNYADIPAGGNESQSLQAVLFGPEHSTLEATATLEYTVTNSNATYRKEKVYDVQITSAPIVMTVTQPQQVVSGANMETSITVKSNATRALSNILLTAEYPFGYTFGSATPAPTYDTDSWLIPTLNPGESETFTIDGSLQGQNSDARTFHYAVGAEDADNAKEIATNFLSDAETTTLNKPPIEADLTINNSPDLLIEPGITSGSIVLTNNMSSQFINGEVDITFSGAALNQNSPNGGAGVYRLSTKTLTYDKTSLPALASLSPGQTAQVSFLFGTLPADDIADLKNGSITMNITVSGTSIDPSTKETQAVSSTQTDVAKIQSSVGVIARTSYSTGPFTNSGPIPPKVDTNTTYTVGLILTNSTNPLSGATVQALLPPYVHWLGNVSPSTENVTFDTQTNMVTWQVGDLDAGGTASVRQVYLQLEVDPTINQVGGTAPILTGISLQGTDTFSDTNLNAVAPDLSTALTNDPKYDSSTSGIVEQ